MPRTKYPKNGKQVKMSPQQIQALSSIQTRMGLSNFLGYQFGGDRDLYTALGYARSLSFEDYLAKFRRQDIAKRIVTAFPNATWRINPKITVPGTPGFENEFEKAWSTISKKLSIFHYLNRLDTLSGIGRYGCLLIGYADGRTMESPVGPCKDVLYLRPKTEKTCRIDKWDDDPTSPRFGKPLSYQVETGTKEGGTRTIRVHYSRILHVAEGLLEDDVYGTPRLESVVNRLEDLSKISGGSAEMFWRGAFQGIAFLADKDAQVDEEGLDDEIQSYVHGMSRYLSLQGMKVQQLSPEIANPGEHFKIQTQLLSSASGIPVRILLGTEEGELASSQDESNWNSRVDERRRTYAEPIILKPLIDDFIDHGILPNPGEDGYDIKWPDINALTKKEQAEVGKMYSDMIKNYLMSGGEMVLPPERFLQDLLGYSKDEAEEIVGDIQKNMLEQQEMPTTDTTTVDQSQDGSGA